LTWWTKCPASSPMIPLWDQQEELSLDDSLWLSCCLVAGIM